MPISWSQRDLGGALSVGRGGVGRADVGLGALDESSKPNT